MILKCKMCGGSLIIKEGETVCTCDYCGTTQTIPLIDSEKKARLFDMANSHRLNNDFNYAYTAYESILSENPDEAEAYWGMVLSEYGVEYVNDPKSHNRVPTCHRTVFQPVLSNRNYKKAVELADVESRMMYENEARELDRLQKNILTISNKEKPYDVFISYKEEDNSGNRTKDSVIAQDLYDALTEKGLNVFFSRISLEDKFGQNYEPYIYGALNTAKVMLLVTTSNENCNSVWVRNEWSRYLSFIKNDHFRTIIPVIKDMSPYELPDELQQLQVLDLDKIGAKQDLIRGVLKITGYNEKTVSSETNNIDSLIKRANMFLEDQDYVSADKYFEKVLDIDPENPKGYIGKILVENKVSSLDQLKTKLKINDSNLSTYLSRIRQFGNEEDKKWSNDLENWHNEQIRNITQNKDDKQHSSKKQSLMFILIFVFILLSAAGGFIYMKNNDNNGLNTPGELNLIVDNSEYKSEEVKVTDYSIKSTGKNYIINLEFTGSAGYNTYLFDSPDGKNVGIYYDKTTQGKNRYTFEIDTSVYEQINELLFSIFKSDTDRCFIILKSPRLGN